MASVFVLLEAFNRKEAAALGFFPCATASFVWILLYDEPLCLLATIAPTRHLTLFTSRLPPLNPPFVGRGLDPSAAPCPYRCFIFHSVVAAYMPPAPPLSKGGGRAREAGGIPAALPLPPFRLPYPFTSFTSFSPLANARAFSIVVMAMLCNAVRVKNA